MSHYVYVIENLLNNKKYVSYTHDPEGRWKEHQTSMQRRRYGKSYLYRAMKKHGVENFRFYVIEECLTMEHGYEREVAWIAQLSTFGPRGYNMTLGGDGPRGRKHTEETRRKMSEAHRGQTPWNRIKASRVASVFIIAMNHER